MRRISASLLVTSSCAAVVLVTVLFPAAAADASLTVPASTLGSSVPAPLGRNTHRRTRLPFDLDAIRGGASVDTEGSVVDAISSSSTSTSSSSSSSSADEERYSRQVYTLGARAHALVRQTTAILDGPPTSGLLYECGKNLALSGVGSVVLLVDDNPESRSVHNAYHCAGLDDLGRGYRNAAVAETGMGTGAGAKANAGIEAVGKEEEELVAEYLRRLNPGLRVSVRKRSEFMSLCFGEAADPGEDILGSTNPVFLSIDRPQSTQLVLNDACRRYGSVAGEGRRAIPFVSVETAGR